MEKQHTIDDLFLARQGGASFLMGRKVLWDLLMADPSYPPLGAPRPFNMPVVVDPSLPDDTVLLRDANDHELGRIEHVGTNDAKLLIRSRQPLTYDDAIYWREPCCHCEYRIDRYVLRDARVSAREYVRRELRHRVAIETRAAGWAAYTTFEYERATDNGIVIRFDCYEQPGFTLVRRWHMPPHIDRLRIQPQNGEPITLDLRRLSYGGELARGALYGTDLHVVLSD